MKLLTLNNRFHVFTKYVFKKPVELYRTIVSAIKPLTLNC